MTSALCSAQRSRAGSSHSWSGSSSDSNSRPGKTAQFRRDSATDDASSVLAWHGVVKLLENEPAGQAVHESTNPPFE